MTDVLTPAQRRYCMSRIRGRNTRPELRVRQAAHALGYRFRLHRKDLPGTPDLVFPRLRRAVFVHGCFWHRHACRRGRVVPRTNVAFWASKREGNVRRDRRSLRELRRLGWEPLVLWECAVHDSRQLVRTLACFLAKPDVGRRARHGDAGRGKGDARRRVRCRRPSRGPRNGGR